MYARLWSRLPGPLAVRLLLATLIVLAVVVVLFAVVFPWVNERLPVDNTSDPRAAAPHPKEAAPWV